MNETNKKEQASPEAPPEHAGQESGCDSQNSRSDQAPGNESFDPQQPDDTPAVAETADPTQLLEQVRNLQREIEDSKDQYLRGKAEVENMRRRSEQEVTKARKFGVERFAAELLVVRDSLDIAQATDLNADSKDVLQKMQEGLALTLKQMDGVFDKFSIEVVNPEPGTKFDPESQQAMSIQASDEVEPNHVLLVVQKGYRLHDRLLRPAMVIVAKAVEGDAVGDP